MTERTLTQGIEIRTLKTMVPIAFLGLLSACAGETADITGNPIDGQTSARPSVSAAELTNDGVNSVSFAQAVAAGFVDNPDVVTNPEPDVAEANPTASVTEPVNSTVQNPDPANSDNDNTLTSIPPSSNVDLNANNESPLPVAAEPAPAASPEPAPAASPEPAPAASPEPATEVITQNPVNNTIEPSTTSVVNSAGDATAVQFSSSTTPGFVGEVLADSIKINWTADPAARGYNVYKQAQYITTVFDTEYVDEDVFDSDYYYEIQAFDFSDELYYIATGLTVSARTLGKTDPNALAPNADLLQDYQLVFSDEFNGSQLDGSKWNTSYLWGTDLVINSEEQYYVDILNDPDFGFNPFTFDGENLTINSIKTPEQLSSKALNQPYLSGVITSYDAFKFTYGYIETRAKVTFGRGYWPAFWLLNAYYVDDKPEIDIMEFIGQDQDVVYHTYHYYDSTGELRSTKSAPTPGIDYTSDFHTYAAEWRPGTIIFYIDGIERHRIDDAKVSQQDMYVIANTALGGWWAGSPDETTPFPGEFKLDYIRVYQKTTPFDDNILFNDGVTSIPFNDENLGAVTPNHRPSKADWPAGYPDGL